jgi:hypothetical protein
VRHDVALAAGQDPRGRLTSSSWLNLVERWFGRITTERIRHGTFTSVPQLERAIYDYIEHNKCSYGHLTDLGGPRPGDLLARRR